MILAGDIEDADLPPLNRKNAMGARRQLVNPGKHKLLSAARRHNLPL
jgi:hypothetical protein